MSVFKKDNNCIKNCNCTETAAWVNQHEIFPQANVKIIGSDPVKCNQLETNTRQALDQLSMKYTISRLNTFGPTDVGPAPLPAVIYNNSVIFSGSVPSTEEIVQKIKSC